MIELEKIEWEEKFDAKLPAVVVDRAGKKVIVGTASKKLCCLDRNGKHQWMRSLPNQVWRLGISDDGEKIGIGTGGIPFVGQKGVYLYSGEGDPIWEEPLKFSCWGFSMSADGNTIVASIDGFGPHGNKLVAIENTPRNGKQVLFSKKGKRPFLFGWYMETSITSDGRYFLGGSQDNYLRFFDRQGQLVIEIPTKQPVYAVSMSADAQTIVAGDRSGHITAFAFNGLKLWSDQLKDGIWAVKVSHDGERIVIGADPKEGHLRVYNRTGKLLWCAAIHDAVSAVDIAEHNYAVIAGTENGQIVVFDGVGNEIYQKQAGAKIRDVAASSSGNLFVAVSNDTKAYGVFFPSIPDHIPEDEQVQDVLKTDFGQLLRSYRERANFDGAGKKLTQALFAERLSDVTGQIISNVAISHWENGKNSPDYKDRSRLLGIIKVLFMHGGIDNAKEADLLLQAGEYRLLEGEEIRAIFYSDAQQQ
jgi:WD40 repeat protein